MRSGQQSAVSGQLRGMGGNLLVLSLALLSSVFFLTRAVSAQPQPPPAEAPAADPWAGYRAILDGDTLEKQREIFRLGYQFLQDKNRDGARTFLARALEVYPLLADYSLYYLGTLHREEAQGADARTVFLRLLSDYPESLWVGRAALELAALALADNSWAEAARYAEQARTAHGALATVRHEAALVLAQAREGQEEVAEAYNLYQELRRTSPHSVASKTATAHVERLRELDPERFALRDDQAHLEEIRLLAQAGEGGKAADLAQQFGIQFSTSSLQPEVLTILAALHKRQGRTEEAIATWQEVVTRYPDSTVAPAALQEWGTLLWNKDRDDEARAVFERLTKRYPRHPQTAEAWYAIGRIFQERKADKRAAAAYQRLATLFPDSPLARDGRWRQGWMAYRRGDFRQAENKFAALTRAEPQTAEGESALYWHARAAERQAVGDKAAQGYRALLRRYPDGYYALWAEKRLNTPLPPLEPGTNGAVDSPALPPRLAGHYRRSQELRAIGLLGLARRELDLVKEGTPREAAFTRFLLVEYSRLEGYAAALRFAQSLVREGTGNWLRYLFPHAYWDTVNAQAREKHLDPYLVLALIRQESLFDPEAVSSAQAYGLMQLLPSTAARLIHAPSVAAVSLTDPGFNIEAGTAYLRQLLDLYDGNLTMAVAAYNAGENAVDKWRTRYPDMEPDEFVENISFRETRNYVKLVLRNYRTYRRLYGGGALVTEE